MKNAAKLIIRDPNGHYLLLYRNNHPAYGEDPDLPGGIVEPGETLREAVLREVREEIGFDLESIAITELYTGHDYSSDTMKYTLCTASLDERPPIALSWEHSSYEWLPKTDFLAKAQGATDTYMHMVWDRFK